MQIVDGASGRTFEVTKSASFPDAVVWNPWVEKAAKMADFGDDEYKARKGWAGGGAVSHLTRGGWFPWLHVHVRLQLRSLSFRNH